jgi:hypothetical protein
MEIHMTVNTITAPQAPRARQCPLCDTPPGQPCQPKPEGDHLARYLDAYTAGQLTKAYMAMVVGELVTVDTYAVVTDLPALQARRAECEPVLGRQCGSWDDDWNFNCTRTYAHHPGVHVHHGPDGEVVAWWQAGAR